MLVRAFLFQFHVGHQFTLIDYLICLPLSWIMKSQQNVAVAQPVLEARMIRQTRMFGATEKQKK